MAIQRWAKRKGTIAERELLSLFWDAGWSAHRIAGSGSSKYPSPDLIAGCPLRKMAIEVKMTNANIKYFGEEEIEGLRVFGEIFGAEPWLAIKFGKEHWYFFTLDHLRKSGKNYAINKTDVSKGLLLEEVIL